MVLGRYTFQRYRKSNNIEVRTMGIHKFPIHLITCLGSDYLVEKLVLLNIEIHVIGNLHLSTYSLHDFP